MTLPFRLLLAAALAAPALAVPVRADDLGDAERMAQELLRGFQDRAERAPAPAAAAEIVIFHTNDIHGQIAPVAADPGRGRPASGGAASLATLVRGETRPRLWIDSGDWFQGTPEGNLTEGRALVEVFNEIGLSAAVLGNHEFDYGAENVRRLAAQARFPVLGANVTRDGPGRDDPVMEGVRPYVIREVRAGGRTVRIGVIGLTGEDTAARSFPGNIRGLRFEGVRETAAEAVAALRRRGADVVIAATHLGIESYGDQTYDHLEHGDRYLAEGVPGIDLILGGHTHTEMREPVVVERADGSRVTITQTGGRLSGVYRITLSVDPGTGALLGLRAELLRLDPAAYPPDAAVAAIVARHQAAVEAEMSRPIGSSAAEMPSRGMEHGGELLLGNWSADVLRAAAPSADLGMINTFGLRAGLPAGPLTYGHVYRLMPFDNRLAVFSVDGAGLLRIAEACLNPDVVSLQFSSEVRLAYDAAAPEGRRLVSMTVGGAPVDPVRTYVVATMDYVASVWPPVRDVPKSGLDENGPLVRDLLVQAVERASPVTASVEGRISRR